MNIVIPGGMAAFQRMARRKRLVVPRRGGGVGTVGPSTEEEAVSGDAGDSLLLLDEGGVTLLHLGMI